ncbi:PREDICTED: alpha-N-acetylneuraminide alpha-2,8-sialyltransferase-like isoform X5 [Branchiostoma belcheri]|uniref:Alpha-N-acetylneuraminide alpha-2,8-sialyltransferase-like isoform X5 n=1 Tax=Branchiostoma belcheri TaxID=7741 RepID=A0A6P4YCF2_BRABE|nr:PREDICTED: alpha-N-acetylneuraminide alpha-2,8-sialyltransferase-like isoform X5 [Branchiostoma belcheri]
MALLTGIIKQAQELLLRQQKFACKEITMRQQKCALLLLAMMVLIAMINMKDHVGLYYNSLTQETLVRKNHSYYKWVPGELAAMKKFKADQKGIPTVAPGWVYNKTAADLFRKQIKHGNHIKNGDFLTTQETAPLDFILKRYQSETTLMNVSREILHRFPKTSPFKAKVIKTCSVVGNGGILKGSGCGKEIDASGFIFRCNMAPMNKVYLKDIGKSTSLITLNPDMIRWKYNSFKNKTKSENVAAFVRDLSTYGNSYLWIPAFFSQDYVEVTFAAHQALREINHTNNEIIIPHPDFIKSAQSYWSQNGLNRKRATTGLYLVSAAIQICEEMHLYGYWPFHSDRNYRRLTEHYFDNALPGKSHSVPDVFK